jgi:hypothetical protein
MDKRRRKGIWNNKDRAKWDIYEQERANFYPAALKGFSHQQLKRQRGLKSAGGQSAPGRKFSRAEVAVIEAQMRKDGKL